MTNENISFNIHESSLLNLNIFLREENVNLIKEICLKKNIDEKKLISEILPSPSFNILKKKREELCDNERCMARLWKGGYGGRCCNIRMNYGKDNEKEFCNTHQKEIDKNGKLRYGRVDEISPFRLPNNPKEPYKRCLHFSEDKQCRCRMSDNSNYCTIHKKSMNIKNKDICGYGTLFKE